MRCASQKTSQHPPRSTCFCLLLSLSIYVICTWRVCVCVSMDVLWTGNTSLSTEWIVRTDIIKLLSYSHHNEANLNSLKSFTNILHNADTSNKACNDNFYIQYFTKLCKYNCRLNILLYRSCSLVEFSWRNAFE